MTVIIRFKTVALLFVLCGCISTPSLRRQELSFTKTKDEQVRLTALSNLNNATDAETVDQAISALEDALKSYPVDLEILTRLSNLYIFKGAAYEKSTKDKRQAFVNALFYAESAMSTCPAFQYELEQGTPVWEAINKLDETYVASMSFWATALFYQFDECMHKLFKPFNLRWIQRAERVLARAYELDPDWGGGQLDFTYGIYYLMPAVAGGDINKSKMHFQMAVDNNPKWLLNRWGRARYLYRKTGNAEAARSDLEWVLSQDATQAEGPIYWNLYCQRDAQNILTQLK